MERKRITIFAGHYGSGKTNIAINYAFLLKNEGRDTVISDLDIVNPYFRTKDSEDDLKKAGIRLISPSFANTNLDLPSLPAQMYEPFFNKEIYCVLDIGGDDAGAYALGRYSPYIAEENNYEMIFVVNFYRPLTKDAKSAFEIMRDIENACGLKFTAIANNSNIGKETTAGHVVKSFPKVSELSSMAGLPVIFTGVWEDIAENFSDRKDILKLKLQEKYFDIKEE